MTDSGAKQGVDRLSIDFGATLRGLERRVDDRLTAFDRMGVRLGSTELADHRVDAAQGQPFGFRRISHERSDGMPGANERVQHCRPHVARRPRQKDPHPGGIVIGLVTALPAHGNLLSVKCPTCRSGMIIRACRATP
jgi:hypothetical protein